MRSFQTNKVFLVLVLLLLSFGLVAGTSIVSLVCPAPPTGEGEGEVAEGEGEVQPEPEPEPEPEVVPEPEPEVLPEGEEVVPGEEVAEGEGEEGPVLSQLAVSPTRLVLEETVTSDTVDVSNGGSGTLNWTAASANPDITITPNTGSGPATVTIQGAGSLFTKFDSNATVTFTNADKPEETVSVRLELVGPGVSSGLKNVALGTTVYLIGKADGEYTKVDTEGVTPRILDEGLEDVTDPNVSAYAWQMTDAPAGSTATLSSTSEARVTFIPDVVGQYTIQCTMTQGGTDFTAEITINVSTFKGIENCALCHNGTVAADKVTPWQGTRHATKVTREIDGQGSAFYNEGCLRCHTVGYNQRRSADNGGFDDVQAETGWEFPATLQAGNYDAMPDDLKNVTNIQCENCHGPGGDHFGNTAKIDVSLKAEVCAQCHDDPPYHVRYLEWKNAHHSQDNLAAFIVPVEEALQFPDRYTSCMRCHSGAGYVAKTKGVADTLLPVVKQVHTCAVCHDPHDATNLHQLRRFGSVDLPPYETDTGGAGINNFDNVGAAATCMYCHNARRTPASGSTRGPHESTAADMLMGINGAEYGAFIANSSHTTATAPDEYCIRCHMAPGPGEGQPGHHFVGGHTYAMHGTDDNGTPDDPSDDIEVENIGACNECHPDLTDFNRPASGNWDGLNGTQGVQDEVKGLMGLVEEQAVANGAVVNDDGTWDLTGIDQVANPDLYAKVFNAMWNFLFVERDRSFGVHNTNYTVVLLQRSYKDLTGLDVPGADIRS